MRECLSDLGTSGRRELLSYLEGCGVRIERGGM